MGKLYPMMQTYFCYIFTPMKALCQGLAYQRQLLYDILFHLQKLEKFLKFQKHNL